MRRAVIVKVAVCWLVLSSNAGAQDTAGRVGAEQSMDIAVTRYVVDASGERIGPPAHTVRYRMSRLRTDKGWHTTVTLRPAGDVARDGEANPFLGGRVEFDHTGVFRMFDSSGREITVPSNMAAVLPAFSADWPESLQAISTAGSQRARVAEVEAKYGRRAGTVRGLAQYVRRAGEDVEELLYDTTLAVPVELNIMRGDELKGRVVFNYVSEEGRGLVRRRIRGEAVVNDEGHRAITITEFSNLTVRQEN